jgi:hypothetical protein
VLYAICAAVLWVEKGTGVSMCGVCVGVYLSDEWQHVGTLMIALSNAVFPWLLMLKFLAYSSSASLVFLFLEPAL